MVVLFLVQLMACDADPGTVRAGDAESDGGGAADIGGDDTGDDETSAGETDTGEDDTGDTPEVAMVAIVPP